MKPPPRFSRYLLVGLVATIAHWGLLALLVERAGVPAWLGSGAGAVFGAQLAFFGNRRFTFGHAGAITKSWWRFMSTAALGAAVGMAVVALTVSAGWHYLAAQAMATALGVLLTFAVNRHWSFADEGWR